MAAAFYLRILSAIAVFFLYSGIALAQQDRADIKSKCEKWLADRYLKYEQTGFSILFDRDGVVIRRADYLVSYPVGDWATTTSTIGFECHYIAREGRIVGVPNAQTFGPQKAQKSAPQTKTYIARWSFTSCPSTAPWRELVDAMERRDYSTPWPPASCKTVRAGSRYLGIFEKQTHRNKGFVKVRLEDGSLVWIEQVRLEE